MDFVSLLANIEWRVHDKSIGKAEARQAGLMAPVAHDSTRLTPKLFRSYRRAKRKKRAARLHSEDAQFLQSYVAASFGRSVATLSRSPRKLRQRRVPLVQGHGLRACCLPRR
jgi:hypothetical protein